MKRLLLLLLTTISLPNEVNANIDLLINERCMDLVNDKACVKSNTKIVSLPKCNSSRNNNCTGELRYTNAYYVGEILNGKEHGFGTMNWANRDKYVGQWLNGEREGQGTYYWANGDKYVGQFKKSERHGQGTYFSAGSSWSGEWRWGKKTENGSYKSNEKEPFYYQYLR